MLGLRFTIDQETALCLILALLNDENSLLRQHALSFAQAYAQALESGTFDEDQVRCFSTNAKITSQAKRSADNFAPIEKQTSLSLLKALLRARLELIEDRNQLSTTLIKVKKP